MNHIAGSQWNAGYRVNSGSIGHRFGPAIHPRDSGRRRPASRPLCTDSARRGIARSFRYFRLRASEPFINPVRATRTVRAGAGLECNEPQCWSPDSAVDLAVALPVTSFGIETGSALFAVSGRAPQ